jgi:hypothetical protein
MADHRSEIFWFPGSRYAARRAVPDFLDKARPETLEHLERQIENPDLRAKLTPDYELGRKRVLISDTYTNDRLVRLDVGGDEGLLRGGVEGRELLGGRAGLLRAAHHDQEIDVLSGLGQRVALVASEKPRSWPRDLARSSKAPRASNASWTTMCVRKAAVGRWSPAGRDGLDPR